MTAILHRSAALWALLTIGLAGCVSTPEEVTSPPVAGTCTVPANHQFIGQVLNAEVQQKISQATGAQTIRVFTPERSMGTTDYRQERLNIHIDEQERIQSMSCG